MSRRVRDAARPKAHVPLLARVPLRGWTSSDTMVTCGADDEGTVLCNRLKMLLILYCPATFLAVVCYTTSEHADRHFVLDSRSAKDIDCLHISVPEAATVECGGIADAQNTPSLDGPPFSYRWKKKVRR